MQSNYIDLEKTIESSKVDKYIKDKVKDLVKNGDMELIPIIGKIDENTFKINLIRDIFNFCSDEQKYGLLQIILNNIREDFFKGYILQKIYQNLTDEQQWDAIRCISEMEIDWKKASGIKYIFEFSHLDQRDILFQMTKKLTDKSWQSLVYGSVFQYLNEEQKQVLFKEMSGMNESDKGKIIQLAFKNANETDKAKLFDFIPQITTDYDKGNVIGMIYKDCNNEQRIFLKQMTEEIYTTYHKEYAEKQITFAENHDQGNNFLLG
jgi:hypothetical protein